MGQVIYRKYRPQAFADVVGQEHVVRTLQNAIASGRIGHAYLFSGPRGTGKTTIARILAKAINCESLDAARDKLKGEPCNRCETCLELARGAALDLVEIDAASNRGIDEIRELRDGVRFSPARARYKVYIIDEAHQLTKEAFNALLKTLEEPPAHAMFVLATTEVERMPATILSRVQRFDFRKFSIPQITQRLARLAKAEKVAIEPAALTVLASCAEGSLRDAESLLEQVIAFSENPITLASAESILGRVNIAAMNPFVDALANRNAAAAIEHLHKLSDDGINLHEFTKGLIQHLRRAMVASASPALKPVLARALTDAESAALNAHVAMFSTAELARLIDRFARAENEFRRAQLPLLPLELAVVQLLIPADQPRQQTQNQA